MSKSVVSRFAAAFGLSPRAEKEETDEERKSRRAKDRAKKQGESDEDYSKRCEELDKKEKAEDEKREKEAAAENPEKEDEPDEKGKKAHADGVKAERARWGAVLTNAAATDRGMAACEMLAETDLSADQICKVLPTLPAQATATGLAARMAAVHVDPPAPGPSSGPVAGSAEATAAKIVAAADKIRGVTPARAA